MADELSHAYDAAKSRAYYLRTRALKGRHPAGVKTAKPRSKAAPKPPVKTRAQRQLERRNKLQDQVDALKARLEKLRTILTQMTNEAKARSGGAPNKSPAKKADSKVPKQTPKQKADAAKRAKKSYEKNKDTLLADEVKSLSGKIKTMQERISKMRKSGSIGTQSK